MHSTQVVAHHVGAKRVEVLAEATERVGVIGARVRIAAVGL